MLFLLASRIGPEDPDSLEIEWRFVQKNFPIHKECENMSCPLIESGIVIHAYLEMFLITWTPDGLEMEEVVVISDFDDNETEVYFTWMNAESRRPRYRFVSHSETYTINHNFIRSFIETISYGTGNLIFDFYAGGREEIIRRIQRYTTDVPGYQDESTIHNDFMRELLTRMIENIDEPLEAVNDRDDNT